MGSRRTLVVEEDTVRVRFLADLIRKELIQKVREQYYPCPISIQFGYHELNTYKHKYTGISKHSLTFQPAINLLVRVSLKVKRSQKVAKTVSTNHSTF